MSIENNQLASIIMKCNNGGKYLEQSLNSVILQIYSNG